MVRSLFISAAAALLLASCESNTPEQQGKDKPIAGITSETELPKSLVEEKNLQLTLPDSVPGGKGLEPAYGRIDIGGGNFATTAQRDFEFANGGKAFISVTDNMADAESKESIEQSIERAKAKKVDAVKVVETGVIRGVETWVSKGNGNGRFIVHDRFTVSIHGQNLPESYTSFMQLVEALDLSKAITTQK